MRKKARKQVEYLSKQQRIQALYESGITKPYSIVRLIRRRVHISLNTVKNTINKLKNGLPLQRKMRVDYQKCKSISKTKQKSILEYTRKNKKVTAAIIKQKFKLNASNSTITRFLNNSGFQFTPIQQIFPLGEAQKEKRIAFCKSNMKLNFKKVCFSDESTFQTHIYPKRTWQEKCAKKKTNHKFKHPLKIHAWGGITWRGPTKLYLFTENMNTQKYIQILKNTLIPSMSELYGEEEWILCADNDPKHTSKSAQQFLKNESIECLANWPSYSPDLNPVENIQISGLK